jgi:DNA modification methylase
MPVIDQLINDDYAIYHSDCMEVLPDLDDNSIDLAIYSPPFPELYQYSDDVRDVTNCVSYQESLDQLAFVVREMSRITKPGRLNCVHCTDLKRGQIYQHDFPGDMIRMHEKTELQFFCRVTIWKDAWEFARRTRMTTLMHKTLCEDASKSRVAPADYLLMFKKRGVNATPVLHEKGFKNYIGGNIPPEDLVRDYGHYRGDPRGNSMSHWIYRQYASPVWMDIRRGRILPYQEARENEEERHVCPLQLDVIDRCVTMWSNPGETILTPFMGVGSEVFGALAAGRKAIGVELKATYYRQAKLNAAAGLTAQSAQSPLFVNAIPEEQDADADSLA